MTDLNDPLFLYSVLLDKSQSKWIQSPIMDGIVLKLNKLNGARDDTAQMMAVTPSPEDMLDAPENNRMSGALDVFCCDPMSISKRYHPDGRKSTRRRRGPGQAVQVLFEGQPAPPEVRPDLNKGSSFASGSHSLSIISSAPQLNNTPNPPTCTAAPKAKGSVKLTRHSSLKQPAEKRNNLTEFKVEEGDGRNYDDMIKFILTEHGIKVISEKEFVV